MKLTESDYKLISYIYHNNREPLSKIAKATKLSREQVDYKIKKYLDSGLIKKFFTVFNYSALGYKHSVSFLLKFEKPCLLNEFRKTLANNKNTISWGRVYSKYDIYINAIFKYEKDIEDYISYLISSSSTPVSDYLILKPKFSELYPLKIFQHKDRLNFQIVGDDQKEIILDEKDKKILLALNKNGRAKLIDLANAAKTSSELALYKLRNLYKNKVILGSRIQFDMNQAGYYFTGILLSLRHLSEANQEKIKKFARQSQNTNSLIFMLAKPNCFIQIIHKDEEELREAIKEIRKLLNEEHFDLEIIPLEDDEIEINALPFL